MYERLANTGNRHPTLRERFPTPEDWIALQGGRPRVFRNPYRPNAAWKVLHVYDEHTNPALRFQSGLIVDTLADRTHNLGLYTIPERVIPATEDESELVIPEHTVVIPTFMLRALHGEVCETRSLSVNGRRGKRIVNQPAYEALIDDYRQQHLEEVRFAINADNQLYMQSLPQIREPRPLA